MPPRILGFSLAVALSLTASFSIDSFPAASEIPAAGQADGSADAVTNLRAYAEYKMGHYDAAKEIWEGLAAKGNTTAMINLSNMFSQGNGVSADEKKAFSYTRQAAELGDARAQHELGLAYERGSLVERDLEKAGEWLRKSAAQDYSDGQFAYGVLLATGRGKGLDRAREADKVEAISWLRKAQARGNTEASGYIELLDTPKRDPKE
ncbi:tetratricopeptide repeat protein [Methylobacterium iners]|uniref:Sel1 domain protein repeat-containing protein n=1 Tax=Methylobacterium iners TaxID=418707 RepID=A0ABQ4RRC1_9HYPH|nr:tetratricopeptide repeat protein [Methylobacterium iners]GJD93326.1 hypothetical protein OCOJLMKI_0518 [Methylobacterium iners]